MSEFSLGRKLGAEFVGTAGLLVVVVGSGIMADNLDKEVEGLALLANSIATGAGLYVLISAFIGISGAHFNPAVSLTDFWNKQISFSHFAAYVSTQCLAAVAGTILANIMFALPVISVSQKDRLTTPTFVSEIVATFGLIGTILCAVRFDKRLVAPMVAMYITGAYWFTSSTSFANPAVTIGRMFSDTFTGIMPASAPGFIVAQIFGALSAAVFFGWLLGKDENENHE